MFVMGIIHFGLFTANFAVQIKSVVHLIRKTLIDDPVKLIDSRILEDRWYLESLETWFGQATVGISI
jgi:hypothetical protein